MSRSISATRASVVRGPSFRFAAIDLPHLQAEADDDEQNRAERDEQAATAVAELGDPVLARVIDRGDNRDAVGNDPGDLGPLKLGSKVSVRVADLNDWCYVDPKGNLIGGFTIEVVQKASREKRHGKG